MPMYTLERYPPRNCDVIVMTKQEQYQALNSFLEILLEDNDCAESSAFESYSGASSSNQMLDNEPERASRYRCILSGEL